MVYLLNEPDCEEFADLLPDGLMFLLIKAMQSLFNGLGAGLTHTECSTTSLGMPVMSEGFH